MTPYLTIAEAAELLRIEESTLRKKMALREFREGVHFFRRRGMRPLFKQAALIAYIEGADVRAAEPRLRMAGGYFLGGGR